MLYKRTRTVRFWIHLLLATLSHLLYSRDCTAISTVDRDFYHTCILLKQIMVFCQKNCWNLKKYKKEGLMFWNTSPKQYQLKCFNNSLCTKHIRAATSVMNCGFFKNIKRNKRNTIYLYKGLFIWEKLSRLILTNKKAQFIWAESFPA